jgi:ubiquinone/menaquinone biosynthesis C-methylase UbiE
MKTDFDNAALQYDTAFTHSVIGKKQRNRVHHFLSAILQKKRPVKILEINCGTGEDAFWLAKQNFDVTATDISKNMIDVAKSKGDIENLNFMVADINSLDEHFTSEKFDFIFSNFGGLNCLSGIRFELFFKNAAELLSENGQMALVIMPTNTLWEQLYFLLKADFKNSFRRKKDCVIANVDGQDVVTYYYNPKETIALAAHYFTKQKLHPIGFFLPPSYLESFFSNKPKLISILETLEHTISRWPFLAKRADHYLISFQKR